MQKTFKIPHLFWGPSILVLTLMAVFYTIILLAVLAGSEVMTLRTGLGLAGVTSPLLVVPIYMLVHNSGEVILTDEAVILRRWCQEKRLLYHDIIAVRQRDLNVPPNLVLQGRQGRLGIHRQAENFAEIYDLLYQKVEILRGKLAFPIRLRITAKAWWLGVLGTLILVTFYLGIGLFGLWQSLLVGDVPPFTGVFVRNVLILFYAVSVLFVPAILMVIAGLVNLKQPVELEFTADRIRFRFPLGLWQSQPASALTDIHLQPVPTTVQAYTGVGVVVRETVRHDSLILEFSNGQQLRMNLDRLKQFDYSSEQLYSMLKHQYSSQITRGAKAAKPYTPGPRLTIYGGLWSYWAMGFLMGFGAWAFSPHSSNDLSGWSPPIIFSRYICLGYLVLGALVAIGAGVIHLIRATKKPDSTR